MTTQDQLDQLDIFICFNNIALSITIMYFFVGMHIPEAIIA